jgi:hypothetical protein
MQPILVRRLSDVDAELKRAQLNHEAPSGGAVRPLYEIIAGERRFPCGQTGRVGQRRRSWCVMCLTSRPPPWH